MENRNAKPPTFLQDGEVDNGYLHISKEAQKWRITIVSMRRSNGNWLVALAVIPITADLLFVECQLYAATFGQRGQHRCDARG